MSNKLSSKAIIRDFLLEAEDHFEIAGEIDAHFSEIKIEIAEKFVLNLIEYLRRVVPERLGENWGVSYSIDNPTKRYFYVYINCKNWTRELAKPMLQFQKPDCNSMIIGIWKHRKTNLPENKIKETLDKKYRKGKQNQDWWPYYVIPDNADLIKNNNTARNIYFHEKEMIEQIANEFITVTTLVKEMLNEMNSE